MLKVSQRTEYAIRAMVDLAQQAGAGMVPARAIAQRQQIPLRFLEQQLASLVKAGLVESHRGAGGGCRLARDPAEITIAQVVDVMEGEYYPMYCLDPADHTCVQDAKCGLQELWGDVYSAVRDVFERTTVAGLAERHKRVAAPFFAPAELIRRP
jgi:Rrf2 family transcriptional regulator, cysteine metabolism repressor